MKAKQRWDEVSPVPWLEITFLKNNYTLFREDFDKAKEMDKKQKISLLEWVRENAVEVKDGWQYAGTTYTDKQLIEFYNKNFKTE